MNEAVAQWRYYNGFIKEVTAERNREVLTSLRNSVISTRDRVCTVSKKKIEKFKKAIKDIDLRIQDVQSRVSEYVNVKVNRVVEFYNKTVNYVNSGISRVKSVPKNVKEKIKNKFKSIKLFRYDSLGKKIEPVRIKKTEGRLKGTKTQLFYKGKHLVSSVKKEKKEKFKKKFGTMFKDVDIAVRDMATQAQEKVVQAEIKVIETSQRLKGNVIQFSNSVKNKVTTTYRSVKNKVANKYSQLKGKVVSVFVSDEETRNKKATAIEERREKIRQLKEYRYQLLHSRDMEEVQEQTSARSRGNIYFMMLVAISFCISVGVIIVSILNSR